MNPTPVPATPAQVASFVASIGDLQVWRGNNPPVHPLAFLRVGLVLGHLTVIAIDGEHVYARQAYRTNVTRRWRRFEVSTYRHHKPRRWPVYSAPVRLEIRAVLRMMTEGNGVTMTEEQGRWKYAVCAPLTAIEVARIAAGSEWEWTAAGRIVCKWRRTSRKGGDQTPKS